MGSEINLVVHEEAHESPALWVKHHQQSGNHDLLRFARIAGLSEYPFSKRVLLSLKNLKNMIPSEALSLCYHELGCDTYLWPTFAARLFQNCYWVKKPDEQSRSQGRYQIAFTPPESPNRLSIEHANKESNASDTAIANVYYGGIQDIENHEFSSELAVEVQMPYFSSHALRSFQENSIAITDAAADEFEQNPYHILRLLSGNKVQLTRDGAQATLKFHQFDFQPHEYQKRTDDELDACISGCLKSIAAVVDKVSLISVSKGGLSGRVPLHQSAYIEEALVSGLEEIASTKACNLKEYLKK
jgi:hypothetical protein